MPIKISEIRKAPKERYGKALVIIRVAEFLKSHSEDAWTSEEISDNIKVAKKNLVKQILQTERIFKTFNYLFPIVTERHVRGRGDSINVYYWKETRPTIKPKTPPVPMEKIMEKEDEMRFIIQADVEKRLRELFKKGNIEFCLTDWIRETYDLSTRTSHYKFASFYFKKMKKNNKINAKFLRKKGRKTIYLINPTEEIKEKIEEPPEKKEPVKGGYKRKLSSRDIRYIKERFKTKPKKKSNYNLAKEIAEELEKKKNIEISLQAILYWKNRELKFKRKSKPRSTIKTKNGKTVIEEEWDDTDDDTWDVD